MKRLQLTPSQKRQIETSVLVGASYLDREHPGWEDDINTETLSVIAPCCCPRGQIFGWILDNGYRAMASMAEVPNTNLVSSELGFWLIAPKNSGTPEYQMGWQYLERQWEKAINARRGQS